MCRLTAGWRLCSGSRQFTVRSMRRLHCCFSKNNCGCLIRRQLGNIALQRLIHFFCILIAVLRLIGASPQYNGSQRGVGHGRGRERLTLHSAPLGQIIVIIGNNRRRRGKKGASISVKQTVQYQPQGINIHSEIPFAASGHLGGHKSKGTFHRHAVYCFFHGAGHTKITQFKVSAAVNKNIGRLDVPMYDFLLLQNGKRRTHVAAEPHNIRNGQRLAADVVRQTGQQFHFDKNIIAGLRFPGDDLVLFIGNDI